MRKWLALTAAIAFLGSTGPADAYKARQELLAPGEREVTRCPDGYKHARYGFESFWPFFRQDPIRTLSFVDKSVDEYGAKLLRWGPVENVLVNLYRGRRARKQIAENWTGEVLLYQWRCIQ